MRDKQQPRLTSPSEVRAWITENGFAPSKVLGQNFLIDGNILGIMLDAAQVSSEDSVLEIGPGLGVLTRALVHEAQRVVAVEKDRRLAEGLSERLGNPDNLTLIVGDAVHQDLAALRDEHGLNKFVANLPYSVGSRILVNAFQMARGFDNIAVTVQLEVAERLAAAPRTSDYGLLSIWAQLDHEVSIAKRVSASCFYPRPTVTSAIVRLERTRDRRAGLANPGLFDAVIKDAFSKRRKQIGTILNGFRHPAAPGDAGAALKQVGIEPQRRPETISVDEWIELAAALGSGG